MQAEMQMGLLHFGEESERPEPNLPLARHFIDTLSVLADKTQGNLSTPESGLLESALTELRFHFVQASKVTEISRTSKANAAAAG